MRRILILVLYVVGFWLLLPGLIFVSAAALDQSLNLRLPGRPAAQFCGALLAVMAAIFLGVSISQYWRWLGVPPVSAFPAPELLQRGLYAVWRHPIYLFYSILLAGAGLLIGSGGLLFLVLPLFLALEFLYVLVEERGLVLRHDDLYRAYRAATPLVVPRLQQWLKPAAFILFKAVFRYQARHTKRLPKHPPYLLVAAHRNYLDPALLALAVPVPVRFVASYDFFRSPLSRLLFRWLGCIPRRRYCPDPGASHAVLAALKGNEVVAIFPEGERSWTGETGALKPEVLRLLRHIPDVPIVPVRLEGTYAAGPRWGRGFHRAHVRVLFQSPCLAGPAETPAQFEARLLQLIRPEDGTAALNGEVPQMQGIGRVLYRCPACRSFTGWQSRARGSLVCVKCGAVLTFTGLRCVQGLGPGQCRSLGEIYRAIRVTDDDISKNSESSCAGLPLEPQEHCVATCPDVVLAAEDGERFEPLSRGQLFLTTLQLLVRAREGTGVAIRLRDISSVTVEGNSRIQVYLSRTRKLYQLVPARESALKWQDFVVKTIEHTTGHSVNRT